MCENEHQTSTSDEDRILMVSSKLALELDHIYFNEVGANVEAGCSMSACDSFCPWSD